MFETFNYGKGKKETPAQSRIIESIEQSDVEEIHLPNLDVSDLIIISEIADMKERVSSSGYQNDLNLQTKTKAFLEEVSSAYSDDELEKTALYHILTGTDIPAEVENLDLEGDYSIRDFMKQFFPIPPGRNI